jgi:lipid-A-disaccharide synthase
MIISGDHSGEKHASKIISQLKQQDPDLHIWGAGGPEMEKAGMELIYNTSELSIVGIVEGLPSLWKFTKMHWGLLRAMIERNPDAILLVDYGGFNIGFATHARSIMPGGRRNDIAEDKKFPALLLRPMEMVQDCFAEFMRNWGWAHMKWKGPRKTSRAIPIYYFISPQVWGSRPWRINVIRRSVNKMLTIFPFEEGVYHDKNVPARFVGHPLLRALPELDKVCDRDELCRALNLDSSNPIIVVMPGSRKLEILSHMPVADKAIKAILEKRPETQFVIVKATSTIGAYIDTFIENSAMKGLVGKGVTVTDSSRNFELMKNCDLIWAKSGTTTLETALFGKPMLIFYVGNWLSYLLVMVFKKVKNFGWPNLLAGHQLVPELIQLDCRAEMLVKYTLDLLDVPGLREEIASELLTLRHELGQGDFVDNAVQELQQVIN